MGANFGTRNADVASGRQATQIDGVLLLPPFMPPTSAQPQVDGQPSLHAGRQMLTVVSQTSVPVQPLQPLPPLLHPGRQK